MTSVRRKEIPEGIDIDAYEDNVRANVVTADGIDPPETPLSVRFRL